MKPAHHPRQAVEHVERMLTRRHFDRIRFDRDDDVGSGSDGHGVDRGRQMGQHGGGGERRARGHAGRVVAPLSSETCVFKGRTADPGEASSGCSRQGIGHPCR
jgi:hypothetical protein